MPQPEKPFRATIGKNTFEHDGPMNTAAWAAYYRWVEAVTHTTGADMKFTDINARLDQLETDVTEIGTVADSAVATINGVVAAQRELEQQLKDALAGGNQAEIDAAVARLGAMSTALDEKKDSLAAAIVAGQTPA